MAATGSNSLLKEDSDVLLIESGSEVLVEARQTRAADTHVGLRSDAVKAPGNDIATDALVIDDPTDADDGDDFILQGITPAMAQVAEGGGFLNQAVLPRFSRGLVGGPGFKTVIQEVADGSEMRISKWQRPKRTFDIGNAIDTPDDFRALLAHYRQVRGSLYGFRMRDPFDWSTHPTHMQEPDPSIVSHRQLIGAGDGTTTTYQLCKRYKCGNVERVRPITHPQYQGSVNDDGPVPPAIMTNGDPDTYVNVIFVDDVEQTEGTHYAWVQNGGQVEFVSAPAAGSAIYWCGTFEIPVRFDQDIDQGLLASMTTSEVFSAELTATELSVPEPFSDHKWMGGVVAVANTSHDVALDPGRGRVWVVQPAVAGIKAYLPWVQYMQDGMPFMTVFNTGTVSLDLVNSEHGSATITIAAGTHAHVARLRDGTLRLFA